MHTFARPSEDRRMLLDGFNHVATLERTGAIELYR
jgi:hypothetical protein